MVTVRELIERFTAWLAKLDESRGKWENPLAKLTGREFYALTGVAAFALLLMLAVAWRSGVNAGQGALPYRAAGPVTASTSAYPQSMQSDLAPSQTATSSQTPSEQAKP